MFFITTIVLLFILFIYFASVVDFGAAALGASKSRAWFGAHWNFYHYLKTYLTHYYLTTRFIYLLRAHYLTTLFCFCCRLWSSSAWSFKIPRLFWSTSASSGTNFTITRIPIPYSSPKSPSLPRDLSPEYTSQCSLAWMRKKSKPSLTKAFPRTARSQNRKIPLKLCPWARPPPVCRPWAWGTALRKDSRCDFNIFISDTNFVLVKFCSKYRNFVFSWNFVLVPLNKVLNLSMSVDKI